MLRRHARRITQPISALAVVVIAATVVFSLPTAVLIVGAALLVAGIALGAVRSEKLYTEPVIVESPVRGRWLAVNSPADKVPSHGTRGHGQAYAIDLVHVPDPNVTWKGIHRSPVARPASAFPAFGQPILAPADGVVITASGWQRDHWSRNSPLGIAYLLPEGLVRELLGLLTGYFVLGNHVVLDLGDGVYAAFAHLRRGSLRVRPGDEVRTGEQIAECGNSGNSSEPHLHFQLMDHPRVALAGGLPFRLRGYDVGGVCTSGVPGKDQPFTAGRIDSIPREG